MICVTHLGPEKDKQTIKKTHILSGQEMIYEDSEKTRETDGVDERPEGLMNDLGAGIGDLGVNVGNFASVTDC